MGSEFSCPCTEKKEDQYPDTRMAKPDIIQTVMKGKLSIDDIPFSHCSILDDMQTKVYLIWVNQLESFFANRVLLAIENKGEYNLYFTHIFISNYLNKNDMVFILLQYKQGTLDKSNDYDKKHKKQRISSSIPNDYAAVYLVETINLVSNDKEKIKEQILNDLNSKLKKQYLFYGIVRDQSCTMQKEYNSEKCLKTTHTPKPSMSQSLLPEALITPSFNGNHSTPTPDGYISTEPNFHTFGPSSSSKGLCEIPKTPCPPQGQSTKSFKNFKILYKKSKKVEDIKLKYYIHIHEGTLENDSTITSILKQHKTKNLKAVMKENSIDSKKTYYFIFEESDAKADAEDSEPYAFKLSKKTLTSDVFLRDITEKLNDKSIVSLICVIDDEDGIFLVVKIYIPDYEFQDF